MPLGHQPKASAGRCDGLGRWFYARAMLFAALVAISCAVVGVIGIVVPVLPGSITVGAGLLIWAVATNSWSSWVAFGVGAVLLIFGAVAGSLLTRRNLKQREIPTWPVIVGLALGVVGLFTIPVVGLPLGFVVGLLVAEMIRLRSPRDALGTSWVAVKSLGVGMLVELGCALGACFGLAASMAVIFFG